MKAREEENGILIEGIRCQYEDQLREMRTQMNEQRIYFETALIEAQNAKQIMELQHQRAIEEIEKRSIGNSSRNKQGFHKGGLSSQSMREFVRHQMEEIADHGNLLKPEIIRNPSPFSNIQIN